MKAEVARKEFEIKLREANVSASFIINFEGLRVFFDRQAEREREIAANDANWDRRIKQASRGFLEIVLLVTFWQIKIAGLPSLGDFLGEKNRQKEPVQENQPEERPATGTADPGPSREPNKPKRLARIKALSTKDYLANLRKKYRTNTSGAPVLEAFVGVCHVPVRRYHFVLTMD
jgi:hypothetical protein